VIITCIQIYSPKREIAPHTAQITRHSPTEPDRSKALVGDTKIPDPETHFIEFMKAEEIFLIL